MKSKRNAIGKKHTQQTITTKKLRITYLDGSSLKLKPSAA